MNFVLPAPDSELFRRLHRTLAAALGSVAWFRVPASMNLVLLASPSGPISPGPGEAALEELAATGWDEIPEARSLERLARRAWRHMANDVPAPPPVPVLTDGLAPVEALFLRDVRCHLPG